MGAGTWRRADGSGHDAPMPRPPSTGITAPVMYAGGVGGQEAHGLRPPRRASPKRPSGTARLDGGLARRRDSASVISVAIGPGATTLTVMLREANSRASERARPDEAGLRRRVVGLAGLAGGADDRRDEDDAAPAGPHHLLHGPLGDAEAAGEVGVDHAREVVVVHAQHEHVVGDAGVGHQHLDRAELGLDRR